MHMIFDFETLSTDRVNGVVLSLALLVYNPNRFNETDQYSYSELLENTKFIKLKVDDQVKNYGRKIDQDTLKWWGEQSKEAKQSQFIPNAKDQPLDQLLPFVQENTVAHTLKKVFSRGNTFDNIFLDYIAIDTNQYVPWPHWVVRDTRSTIEGMAYGSELSNSFIPEGLDKFFIPHDPQHDIVMDVMRMQALALVL